MSDESEFSAEHNLARTQRSKQDLSGLKIRQYTSSSPATSADHQASSASDSSTSQFSPPLNAERHPGVEDPHFFDDEGPESELDPSTFASKVGKWMDEVKQDTWAYLVSWFPNSDAARQLALLQAEPRVIHASQPRRTQSLGYPSNKISNTKYTWWNFIPMMIRSEFSLHINRYFLLIALLQLFPSITPVVCACIH
jgi:hypothetical protein